MSTKMKTPRRLRLRPGCRIQGVIQGRILEPGLYVRGQNIDEESFDKLLSPEFKHAVEALPDRPPAEPLAEIRDAPRETETDKYMRKLRETEEKKYKERWPTGKPTQTSII